ncbi:MAG: hybrid sensor histidine kinase/response regulator [Pseudooceanicola sp.]|jgi:signal transduction histidine kinase/DNA-binding response OmpR family regulator|nr:hybrid sensor histidine kinase/response regulator [Pseudooceanicola sp.]
MNLANMLSEERRARLAAERKLELKEAELSAANRKLGRHALALTREIGETRAEVATVRDENERVKSDLSVANQKIQVAERRLWHSIRTIQDGFAFFDADGLMIAANSAYIAAFDGLEEVAPGVSYPRILQLLTDEGLVDTEQMGPKNWRAMMLDRWASEAPEPIVIRWWNGMSFRLIDQRGPGGDMVSIALDITATVRYEEQLKAARDAAETASRAKSSFLANMSHEIRTPMNGVVGMAELLMESDLSEEQRLYASTIHTSAEALLRIINDILDYSKIEAEKLVLHPQDFDLEHCVHDIVTMLQPVTHGKDVDLLVDYDLFLPTRFIADPGRVRQILINLVGNAVKFTRKGHVAVRVTGLANPGETDCTVHITVEDTGVGMSPEEQAQIFGEFQQVASEANREFEGTGLGLAITRRLVELMQGHIWVDSTPGKGSVFGVRLTLPLADPDTPMPVSMPDSLRRVMIVGQPEPTQSILSKQLEQLGLQIESCLTGPDALQAMTSDIDLVISEHAMAGMDGLELVEALRAAGWDDLPFLLVSLNGSAARSDPAFRLVQGSLQRPYQRSELLDRLVEAMTGCDARAPLPEAGADTDSPLPNSSDTLRQMRILSAEDNKTNQLVFRKMVKSLDISLDFASNGEEAVAAFQSAPPDLIFMDVSMPRKDGCAATREIRELEQALGTHVPIIALTAHAMNGDSDRIMSAGMDRFMSKPLRKAEILNLIAEFQPADARPVALSKSNAQPEPDRQAL